MMSILVSGLLFVCLLANAFGVTVVSRSEWGARSPVEKTLMHDPKPYAIIHHTATSTCSGDHCKTVMKGIQNFHMDTRGWSDIGYNFLVGADGVVYEGRGWGVLGTHARGWNNVSYGFSVVGNFMTNTPTQAALSAIRAMIEQAVKRGYLTQTYNVLGHRDVGNTSCPGDAFYEIIKTWPDYGKR
ncbi:unnamed protein product [Calicophoron daubneyi]|uniref:Peptidoglycan-recognition protein n=1 Tax=Calicophoron daubneyi TaxID=300641 RepID=A0AAV2TXY3_CALDB